MCVCVCVCEQEGSEGAHHRQQQRRVGTTPCIIYIESVYDCMGYWECVFQGGWVWSGGAPGGPVGEEDDLILRWRECGV